MIANPAQPWLFDPWNLGNDVRLGGIKLLVVAESHYREDFPLSEFKRDETKNLVREHGIGVATSKARTPFYRAVTRLLETDNAKDGDLWRHIYFYNYFQRVMDTPNERPTQEDYIRGVEPFDAVLRAIQPDAVLVVSARLWRGMKNDAVAGDECALGRIYEFSASIGWRIPGANTHHPSARSPNRFKVSEWRPKVDHFLQTVREARH